MVSPLDVREFIRERLAVAAEEIFGVFEKTVLRYEEELSRQRRMVELSWRSQKQQQQQKAAATADLPQEPVGLNREELPAQWRSFSPHQEESEAPQIKEEQEEPCSSLQLKEESGTFLVTYLYGDGEPRESEDTWDHLQSLDQDGVDDDLESTSIADPMGDDGHEGGVGEVTDEDVYPPPETLQDSGRGKAGLKCGVCGKVFKNKYHLKVHDMIHTGVKPYVCNDCGKSFKEMSALRYHQRTHTDERPYSCETCGKSFRCSYSVLVHTRTHTGERPYLCNTCGKRFTNPSAFKWHRAIHMGDRRYSCGICEKSFTQSGNLKAHMRTHTGEKKHCCQTCGKSFGRSNNLIVHMRTHTGEKPYPCSTCGERFQYATALKKHVMTHGGQD